jgi:hypothetical protein
MLAGSIVGEVDETGDSERAESQLRSVLVERRRLSWYELEPFAEDSEAREPEASGAV